MFEEATKTTTPKAVQCRTPRRPPKKSRPYEMFPATPPVPCESREPRPKNGRRSNDMTATLHVSIFRIGVCVALVTVILGAADLRAQTITHEYQAVILHPPGVRNSQAVKINWSAHEVVGESWAQALDEGQALEWTGAGTNVVSLSPGSRFGSRANGISGNQVGGTVSTIG